MSGFCSLCYKDPGTGALLCARLGKWIDKCPGFHGVYRDADRKEDGKWAEV